VGNSQKRGRGGDGAAVAIAAHIRDGSGVVAAVVAVVAVVVRFNHSV